MLVGFRLVFSPGYNTLAEIRFSFLSRDPCFFEGRDNGKSIVSPSSEELVWLQIKLRYIPT